MNQQAQQWTLDEAVIVAHDTGWSIGHAAGSGAAVVMTPDGQWHALVQMEVEAATPGDLLARLESFLPAGTPVAIAWEDLERLR